MRIILLVFLVLSFSSFGQKGDGITLVQKSFNESENSFQLIFENFKKIESNKMPLFTKRLENYYKEIDSIEYISNGNKFVINFNKTEVSHEEISDILSHFDIYNFEIKRL